jgi:alpha-tubulin suppressor-like RCC1 family protein
MTSIRLFSVALGVAAGLSACQYYVQARDTLIPPKPQKRYVVPESNAPSIPPGGVQAIVSGRLFSCGLSSEAKVSCWGANGFGQLGDGTLLDHPLPILVTNMKDVTQLGAGDAHACALNKEGKVYCWGQTIDAEDQSSRGERGPIPRLMSLSGKAHTIAVGRASACAHVEGTNDVTCWGAVGNHTFKVGDVAVLAAGDTLACAIVQDTTVRCWGPAVAGGNDVVTVPGIVNTDLIAVGASHACAQVAGVVSCWGTGAPLGNGQSASTSAVVPAGLEAARQIALDEQTTCVLSQTGRVDCWGEIVDTNVASGHKSVPRPQQIVSKVPLRSISVHGWRVCGVATDGTALCDTGAGFAPVGVPKTIVTSVGDSHGCAISEEGEAFCWGRDDFGQLGDGTTDDPNVPKPVGGVNHGKLLSMGRVHECVVADDGSVQCWGDEKTGRLLPVSADATLLTKPRALFAGEEGTYLVREDGGVVYWGTNNEYWRVKEKSGLATIGVTEVAELEGSQQVLQGKLFTCVLFKDGSVLCSRRSDHKKWTVNGVTDVAKIALGTEIGCALLKTGAIKCWRNDGDANEALQAPQKATDVAVGDGDDVCAISPKGVNCWRPFAGYALDPATYLKNATQLAIGSHHACARLTNAAVWCWGANGHGQLGDGTTQMRMTPTTVKDLAHVRQIAAMGESTCALLEDGTVHCWGRDTDGYLGVQRVRAASHEARKVAF